VKLATLHDSDFVQENVANTKTNTNQQKFLYYKKTELKRTRKVKENTWE
jgi:hypothetical protein